MFSVLAYRMAIVAERVIRKYDRLAGLRQFFEVVFELPVDRCVEQSAGPLDEKGRETCCPSASRRPCCVDVGVGGSVERVSSDRE